MSDTDRDRQPAPDRPELDLAIDPTTEPAVEDGRSMTEPDTSYSVERVSLDSLDGLEELRSKPSRTYSEEFVERLKRAFRREEKNFLADDPLFIDAQCRFDAGELSLDQVVNYFLTEWTPSKPQ